MNSFASIIDTLGGGTAVASAINEKAGTVRQWKRRQIPADRWLKIVELAERCGNNITYEDLARLAKPRKPNRSKRKTKKARAV